MRLGHQVEAVGEEKGVRTGPADITYSTPWEEALTQLSRHTKLQSTVRCWGRLEKVLNLCLFFWAFGFSVQLNYSGILLLKHKS